MRIQPVSDAFGAVVSDVNLSVLSDSDFSEIESLWHRYAVLVFPNQWLNDDDHKAFARRFGRLERGLNRAHPPGVGRISNVDRQGKIVPITELQARFNVGNSVWHTDSSYKRVAAKASLLAADEVPETGGETEWADMRAGYDALAESTKDWLEDKIAVHSYRYSHAWHGGLELLSPENLENLPPVQHAIVKTHPDSHRKILFLGRHASHIVGEDKDSSRKILRELTFDAARPPRTWKHRWQPGDVSIWDNRCVLHRGHRFPSDQRRVMARATVAGDDPENEWAE